jgi:type VI secretion system protein ImpH
MAPTNGQKTDSLIAKLRTDPFAFDFFAAVRLLQHEARDQPRIGYSWTPAQDPVRFAQNPAMEFAPSTLEALRQEEPARAPVLYSRHFGLFGPNGPLPLCLTEFARQRILHHGDATFTAFSNVFHHRLISFLFRAWADARKTVDSDRPEDSNWSHYIGALVGLGMDSMRNRDSVPDSAKLFFAGRMAPHSRNAEGLEAILQVFFGVATELQTFVGRWMTLPPGSTCKLGDSLATGRLGSTAIAGNRIWTCQHHIRVRFGPLKRNDFQRLLPNGQAFSRLRDWIRLYTGEEYSWDVQLVLVRTEVPALKLGGNMALGWNTWVSTQPFADDAIICFTGAGEN